MNDRLIIFFCAFVCLCLPASLSFAQGCVSMQGAGGPFPLSWSGATTYVSETALFAHSSNCAFCHDRLMDGRGYDVSFFTDWSGTMMANAGRDPLWQAKVHSEILRSPHLKTVIEERCSRCHMPMANVQAEIDGGGITLVGGGLFSPGNQFHALAVDGVSCALCHQIQPGNLGTKSSFSGSFSIDRFAGKPYRLLFGPFPNPVAAGMMGRSGFLPGYEVHMEESALCGTCHTVYVPVIDATGAVVGESPEQTPYLEWRNSAFSLRGGKEYKSCQRCHLPKNGAGAFISLMPRRLLPRMNVGRHHMNGGNALLLSILRDNPVEMEVNASWDALERATWRTLEQLRRRTADIAIEGLSAGDGTLEVRLRVTNETGHKFPTGVPLRRAWIHLTVKDGSGKVVFESGRPRLDGSIDGNDADSDLSMHEPHYDLIDSPEKVQIYEAITMDTENNVTYTFLRGKEHIKDNRLLPRGFDKAGASPEIQVHGEASEDWNFVGGSDRVTFRASTAGLPGPFSVRAEILYSSISHAFLKDLNSLQGKSGLIRRFGRLYEKADAFPIVIGVAEEQYSGFTAGYQAVSSASMGRLP
ncbi:MAG: hypothetical protein HY788_03195 [Deltaproteobacteria bacterium]|nr:hypothetical protein [Deltaproteobacteria bacterium]